MSRNSKEFFAPPKIPDTHYVDNRIYWDEGIFAEEQEKIFKKVWKFVCHESELPEIFDYRTANVAGTPLVIARGKDRTVRAFVNSCSHRGPEIVRNLRGNAKEFECLFHRWIYDASSGECIGMPRGDAFERVGLDRSCFGLRQVRCEEYLGLTFINLDDGAGPLREFIGNSLELEEEILGTKPLEVFDYYEQVLETNWKNWQETNMDLYHEYMHVSNRRTSLSEKSYFERNWRTYPHGHVAIERYKVRYDKYPGWKDRDSRLSLPGLDPAEFQLINLFPDIAINARGTVIRLDSQIPLAPNRTLVQYRGLAIKGEPDEDRSQRARDFNQFWGIFGRNQPEDLLATSLQGRVFRGKQVPYTYWARDEGGKTQDDVGVRSWYVEWARLMGRQPSRPFNA